MQNTIAIICDCDETLAPDTTSLLLEKNGIDVDDFWKKISKQVNLGWDPPLAWMSAIVDMIKSGKIKQDTNEKISKIGKYVKPYDGVTKFVPALKKTIQSIDDFVDANVTLESYIISSGIEDLIKGSSLANYFDDIFAGRFSEDPKTGKINGIQSSVTFTEKTKFLYAINKGISGETLRKYPYRVNDSVSLDDRRIPFEYMIYLGDGPSDIPCFSAIKGYGGNCIGIIGNETAHKGYQLARGKRTTVGPYSQKYTKDGDLYLVLETIIKKVGYEIVDKKRRKQSIV